MREYIIQKNDAGQRLDRWLTKNFPLLPAGLRQKYLRLGRVKVNGKKARREVRLQQGDALQLYINDGFLEVPERENTFFKALRPRLDILYEDEYILLVNKAPGMVVHGDEHEKVNTLVNHIQAYLYQKGEWNPAEEGAFAPALCNRIDRNTGGIVIAAKTAEALRVMNQKIRDRELVKTYLCVAVGQLEPPSGQLRGYILKDEANNQVYVRTKPAPGGRTALTRYRTLAARGDLTLVECELITGRTHQIRAQLAHVGCPLLGDGKYGRERVNRQYGLRRQALWSWGLDFRFTTPAGELEYLNGKSFRVPSVPFVEKYFPDWETRETSSAVPRNPEKKQRRKVL